MGKILKIILIIFGVLLVAGIIGGVLIYKSLFGDEIDAAILSVESGEVSADTGRGWQPAQDGMRLSLSDKIKTGEGTAAVTFYESIIVELDSNTEVSIGALKENNVQIKQESGSTWNKFTAISGIDNYAVETPTTVATVRGTEFGVDVGEEEDIIVGEGQVNVESEGNSIMLGQLQKARKAKGAALNLEQLSPEEKLKIAQKARKNIGRLIKLREKMIQRKMPLIRKVMERYGVSESELKNILDKIDSGEIDDAALIERFPIKAPVIYRFMRLNDAIKNQKRLVDSLEGKKAQSPLVKPEETPELAEEE